MDGFDRAVKDAWWLLARVKAGVMTLEDAELILRTVHPEYAAEPAREAQK